MPHTPEFWTFLIMALCHVTCLSIISVSCQLTGVDYRRHSLNLSTHVYPMGARRANGLSTLTLRQ